MNHMVINIMSTILSWFLCVLVSTTLSATAATMAKDIFILAGQSNMAGRGGVINGKKWDGNTPSECKPNPLVKKLNGKLIWEEAREPLHADIDVGKTCGVGPGLVFANEVVRLRESSSSSCVVVGLVPCAVGGTRIEEWSRGSRLYDELVRRSSYSVRDGGGGVIRALVWFQGESDTVREEDAVAYKGRMETLIQDLRFDLHLPSLLVIQVAIASGEGKFIEEVREAQLGIKLPNVKCVDAKGLKLKEDKLHLTTISQLHLGIKLAHAYLSFDTKNHFNYTQLT